VHPSAQASIFASQTDVSTDYYIGTFVMRFGAADGIGFDMFASLRGKKHSAYYDTNTTY
jgi:hypothetical protein